MVLAVHSVDQFIISLSVLAFFVLANCFPDSESCGLLIVTCGILGIMFGYGIALAGSNSWLFFTDGPRDPVKSFGIPLYVVFLALFHIAEFLFVVCFHTARVSFKSFLIVPVGHGGYSIAMGAAMLEFWGRVKLVDYFGNEAGLWALGVMVPGFVLALGGWALRCLALFTAQANFTHQLAYYKTGSHQLVTHGIYSCCRHPSYLGWFLFCTGTQVVLVNPICYFLYFAAAWHFFAERIPEEESLLLRFFGSQYVDYAARVPCGLPWMPKIALHKYRDCQPTSEKRRQRVSH